jgi:hypothetical protein
MKFNVTILLIALSVAGCGKKVDHDSKATTLSAVEAQLNNGEFEKAIETLESLKANHPNDEQIKIKLLHSYAGAGSFEALKVVSIWKEVEGLLKELRKSQEDDLKASAKQSLDNFAIELEKLFAPIPELSPKQKLRLNQAITLYQELGFKVETAGKYNNFKWGTLHIYRLAVTLKELVKEAKEIQVEGDSINLKAIERAMIPKLKVIGQDIFMAYKLFGNSFDKIKKITESIDKIVAKTVNDKDFKLKVNALAKSEGEFFSSLIQDNINAASVLVKKLGDIYVENGHQERLQNLVKTALPSEQEIKASERRIEALVKVFIKNFTSENPEIEERLKSIFTESLKQQIIASAKESIKVKNTNPLKELLASKKPEIEVLNSYYLLLKNEVKASDIEEELKDELESLKKKVDLELIKEELKAISEALKEDTQVIKLGAETIMYSTRDQLLERQKLLKKETKWLEKYLGDLNQDLKQSIESENPDQEEMDKIIQETKIFVESK